MIELLLLALALSMDATAVAMTRGAIAKERLRPRDALLVALTFGGFQAAMPALGYAAGAPFEAAIEAWDHWIAFVLLAGIGVKMIHEGLGEKEEPESKGGAFALRTLLLLGVATSIDALVAGLTLSLLELPIALSVATIGVVTAVASFAGVHAGRRFGARMGGRLDVVGGLVLVALGAKTLVSHLVAG